MARARPRCAVSIKMHGCTRSTPPPEGEARSPRAKPAGAGADPTRRAGAKRSERQTARRSGAGSGAQGVGSERSERTHDTERSGGAVRPTQYSRASAPTQWRTALGLRARTDGASEARPRGLSAERERTREQVLAERAVHVALGSCAVVICGQVGGQGGGQVLLVHGTCPRSCPSAHKGLLARLPRALYFGQGVAFFCATQPRLMRS